MEPLLSITGMKSVSIVESVGPPGASSSTWILFVPAIRVPLIWIAGAADLATVEIAWTGEARAEAIMSRSATLMWSWAALVWIGTRQVGQVGAEAPP